MTNQNRKKKQDQNLQDQKNRIYYQRMYDQIHTSQEFKERLIHMKNYQLPENQTPDTNTRFRRKTRRTIWKTAAAAAALCIALPCGAYAAGRYFGLYDYFLQSGNKLSEDADKLIETNIAQKTETKTDTEKEYPVKFEVQEALCDSGTVSIIIKAEAAESGKYLLVPSDCLKEDPIADLGIEGSETVGEYAASKNLEILHVSPGFHADSPFSPDTCSIYTKAVQDDVMTICINADRSKTDTSLDSVLELAVREDGADFDDILRSSVSFTLEDKSSSKVVQYLAENTMDVPDTHARITKVEMEETEVHTYVKVYYTNPSEAEDDGLTFRIKDSSGRDWTSSGGRGVEQLDDGSYSTVLVYNAHELPKQCTIEAFNCWDKTIYGQFELTQAQ